MLRIHGNILRYGLWTRQINMIGQRKPRKVATWKYFKLLWGCNSVTLSLNPPMCLFTCTAFPPNKHFTSSTSRFMGIHFDRTSGPGSCHWQLLLWPWWPSGLVVSALIAAWLQSLAGNWNPAQSCCRPRPPEIIFGAETQEFKVNRSLCPAAAWGP